METSGRLHVFLDFDGTITRTDTLQFLTERFGGGPEHYRETGRLLDAGALSLREGVARDMGSLRVPLVEAAGALRAEVEVDPGFAPLVRQCAAANVPVTVLSAGFHELIDLFIPPGAFPGLEVCANRFVSGTWQSVFRDDSALGHDKARAVAAARAAGVHTIFAGDGISDREPAAVADEVFARAGRPLVEYCRALGIRCHVFASLDDVARRVASWLDTRRAAVPRSRHEHPDER